MIKRLKQDPLREDSLDYYLFVIDTDKDVGNCYREICAEITGLIGDDQVGKDIAFLAEFYAHEAVERFKKIVTYVPDDRGCARPVRIFPSPFYGSDTFGNYA